MFFSLLKKTATSEQLEEIFRVEKQMHKKLKKKQSEWRRKERLGEGSVGCGDTTTEHAWTGVFSRLGKVTAPGQSPEVKLDQPSSTNVFSRLTWQGQSPVDTDPERTNGSVVLSHLNTSQGQRSEVKGEERKDNVFSRLCMPSQIQGQSSEVAKVNQTELKPNIFSKLLRCPEVEPIKKEAGPTEVKVQDGIVIIHGACQAEVWHEGAGPEGESSMEIDTVRVKEEVGGCGLNEGLEAIWEREKEAALEFDDTDSGVEFAIPFSLD